MYSEAISYDFEGLEMEGYLAKQQADDPMPLVLIIHDWTGNREFSQEKARYFAKQGFVAFALDLYGKGNRGSDTDKSINQKLLSELLKDRASIVPKITAGLNCAMQHAHIVPKKVMLIGFCMGGMCALDYARSGVDCAGVVSVHGLLHPPHTKTAAEIKAKVLVMHGFEDKSVPGSQVLSFAEEMTKHKADWQIHMFGNTYHAFTNPKAKDLEAGLMYNQDADSRTWAIIRTFTDEILS